MDEPRQSTQPMTRPTRTGRFTVFHAFPIVLGLAAGAFVASAVESEHGTLLSIGAFIVASPLAILLLWYCFAVLYALIGRVSGRRRDVNERHF